MELKRDIYKKLLAWKEENSGQVLQISGARQVGKTYIIDKFAKENYNSYIYINMAQTSGAEFLACLEKATKWEPGTPRKPKPVHEAVQLFYPEFKDQEDTVIVIDEIQESARVFNLVRVFAREFSCHVIIMGSYLGRLLSKEFFLPAGDVEDMTLEPLTFAEFTEALGYREIYETTDLFGQSEPEQYACLKGCYDIYQRIGGYPSVVKLYIQYKDLKRCEEEIRRLMSIFTDESKRYFEDVMEADAFDKLFHGVAVMLIREKQGTRDLVEDLSRIVYKQESGRFTKTMIHHAIGWLRASHILGYAGKSIDCDYLEIRENARFYFLDMGVAHYFVSRAGADEGTLKGISAENFVYLMLRRHIDRDIAGSSPWFASYEKTKGELDFYVRSREDYKNYGIEVKAGSNSGITAARLLQDGKLDYLYYLKGDTKGGRTEDGTVMTVPLYLADRINFNLGK